MSQLVDMREVLARFHMLQRAAREFSKTEYNVDYKVLDLHDAAMRYVAAVRKVVSKGRGQ